MAWIFTDECDSLLFSCLDAVARNEEFPIEDAFFVEPGENEATWHRRPKTCGSCSSTISRDMFMGLLVYCLHFARLDLLDAFWNFGWKHWWKMGMEYKEPTEFQLGPFLLYLPNNRVWFTPGLIALLACLRAHLRG